MTSTRWRIRSDDLSGEPTRALLRLHLAGMQSHSPPEHIHALDLSGLTVPDVRLWSVWDGDSIAGMGALKIHADGGGEIKSMRTHPDFLRQGVAARLLRHIIDVARSDGMYRLSLETGRGPAFEPALSLYRRHGFVEGDAFAGCAAGDFSQFLHLAL